MDNAAIIGILNSILEVLSLTWWIIPPVILAFVLKNLWFIYCGDYAVKKMKWITLEIKVPKDILTTPKAMEQVFANLYGNYSHGFGSAYKYWDGAIDDWFSLEIVGYAHGVHFYAYIPEKRRNMVEAGIYSQYPDAEIHEVEDYTELLPEVLPSKAYNLWGADLVLGRPSYLPIRTYPSFEESVEERRIDPIAALTEVMSNLKGEERIWWQVIVSPSDHTVGNDWKKEGDKKIDEIAGKKINNQSRGFLGGVIEFFLNLIKAPVEYPAWGAESKKDTASIIKFLSPAEQEVVKVIDNKISKLGFETVIRFLYIDRADTFTTVNASAIMGTIRQFNTQNLNEIKPHKTEKTILSGWKPKLVPFYEKWKMFSIKKRLYSNYRLRRLNGRMVGKFRGASTGNINTMNTEELATIYHFPTMMVGAPKLRRLPSKKGEPPAGLPIEELV